MTTISRPGLPICRLPARLLTCLLLLAGTSQPAAASSGGITGQITAPSCSTSGCHTGISSASGTVGFLTFTSQSNTQGSIDDLTLKRNKTYTMRFLNNIAMAPGDPDDGWGFNLGDSITSNFFKPLGTSRVKVGTPGTPLSSTTTSGSEVTHASPTHNSWTFRWQPTATTSSGVFRWCTQRVNGDGLNNNLDGPFQCATSAAFTVENNVTPAISAQSSYVFLETSSAASRVINIDVTDTNTGDLAGLTYQWTNASTGALATGLSSTSVQDPTFTSSSRQVYRVTATDEFPATGSFNNIVVDLNPRPTAAISGVPLAAVLEGTQVTTVSGANSTDSTVTANAASNANIAEYRWRLLDESGAEDQAQTGPSSAFVFTAPELPLNATQNWTIELIVVDAAGQTNAGGAVSSNITFIDLAVGDPPPVVQSIGVSGENEGAPITLTALVSEPIDDANAVWTQTAGSPTVALSGSGLVRSFTTDISDPNTPGPVLQFNLMVTDSVGQSANRIVDVPVNNGPTASAGNSQAAAEGDTVTLDASSSFDPDGAFTRLWVQTDGSPQFSLNDATAVAPQFVANTIPPGGSVATFQLTVTDDRGLSDTDSVQVTLTNVNTPPVASAGEVQTAVEGELVTLNGSGSVDDDLPTLTYAWSQTGGIPVTLSDSGSAMPTFTAPVVGFDSDPVLSFQLTVTDAEGETSQDSVLVNVTNDNMAPVANAGDNQNVSEGLTVMLDGSASTDPDLAQDDALTFLWEQIAGAPLSGLANIDSAVANFVAPTVGVTGRSATFRLTVTDRGGLVDTDETVVNIVNLNQPPIANAGADQFVMGDDDSYPRRLSLRRSGW